MEEDAVGVEDAVVDIAEVISLLETCLNNLKGDGGGDK